MDVEKCCTNTKLGVEKMLLNFPVNCEEVEKLCSGYSGTLPLIFPHRLANKKIYW